MGRYGELTIGLSMTRSGIGRGLAGSYSTPCTATMRSRAAPSRSVLACR
jgi:hypothetical protein